jgi:hypothetical protein
MMTADPRRLGQVLCLFRKNPAVGATVTKSDPDFGPHRRTSVIVTAT